LNDEDQEASSNGPIWAIIGVVGVIGAGVGAYFYQKGKKGVDKEGGESEYRKLYKDHIISNNSSKNVALIDSDI
jgi:hypothetical protein